MESRSTLRLEGGAASWNPALRPNAESSSAKETRDDSISRSKDSELPSASSSVFLTTDSIGPSGNSEFSLLSQPDPVTEDPLDEVTNNSGDGGAIAIESLTSSEEPWIASQDSLDGSFFDKPNETVGQAENLHQKTDEEEENGITTSENYGYQGSANLLEEATHDDATSPLLNTIGNDDGWGEVDDSFNIESDSTRPENSVLSSQQGLTVNEELSRQGPMQTSNGTSANIDWGNLDDGEFNISKPTQHATAEADHGGDQSQEDLDALWKAALEDDELLDENVGVNPAAFNFDDGEGFLEDTPAPPVQDLGAQADSSMSNARGQRSSSSASASRYAPAGVSEERKSSNAYGLDGPQFTDFSQLDKSAAQQKTYPGTAYGIYSQPFPNQQGSQSSTEKAQSFADKSKGGYSSPYDLPMDVTKPRRSRASQQPAFGGMQPSVPPPRSSSMNSTTSPASASVQSFPVRPGTGQSTLHHPPNVLPSAGSVVKETVSRSAPGDFFAELPVVPKTRTPSSQPGRYTPPSSQPARPAPPLSMPVPGPQAGPEPLVAQLQAPEKMSPFPDVTPTPMQVPSAPSISSSRYSPAPPTAPQPLASSPSSVPTFNPRYSPAPPVASGGGSKYSPLPSHNTVSAPANFGAPPRSQTQPFAPRTSSPLAYSRLPEQSDSRHPQAALDNNGPLLHHAVRASSSHSYDAITKNQEPAQPQSTVLPTTATPPPMLNGLSPTVVSPTKRGQSNYVPHYQPMQGSIPDPVYSPPKRTSSQSPSSSFQEPGFTMTPMEKPASFNDPTSPPLVAPPQQVSQRLPQRVGFSGDLNYIVPQDERASDPLERWKGAPLFKWGLGGTILTSFPKHVPRYSNAQASPMILCAVGEVKIQSVKDICPLDETIAKYPGPLKGKSKKKELLVWMNAHIERLESAVKGNSIALLSDSTKRQQEKILLWKVMHVFVEQDGRLEGNESVTSELRKVLGASTDATSDSGNLTAGPDVSRPVLPISPVIQPDAVYPQAVGELRAHLSKGEREKAAWHAVDHRLWAHALLISSTLDKTVWKNVVQEFVRQEVKKMGGNTKALAALYEVFAGNWEESIDELVPPSARAGFQMVSTAANHGQSRNALDGLDQWQETLLLVLSNRSDGDINALVALGRLLADYGRMEAAHVCFLFARSVVRFGGLDDPSSDVVLLGADHKNQPQTFDKEPESIILTEVFEFAMTLSGVTSPLPHLQPYKLAQAYLLAEYGYKNEAAQYCDAIASSVKLSSKISPYLNGNFVASLDELTKRLSMSPKDGSSSWITKPTVEKVSGSLYAKFTSFVAGDDSDAASNTSTGEVGPFAKIAGNTPTISPAPSSGDLRSTYSGGAPLTNNVSAPANSRYAPQIGGSSLVPPEQRNRSKYDPQGPGVPYMTTSPETAFANDYRRGSESANRDLSPSANSYGLSQYSPPASRGQIAANPYMLSAPMVDNSSVSSSYSPNLLQAKPPGDASDTEPNKDAPSTSLLMPSSSPANLGYSQTSLSEVNMPPSSYAPPQNSYEPPSYTPYLADESDKEDAPEDKLKKKKSMMDDEDDDDIAQRAARLKKEQNPKTAREPDDAVKRAAEADAARDKAVAAQRRGWLSGWFKKDSDGGSGPIKAKLGEKSSFYFDPELKKWVNKNAGDTPAAETKATPPPPKGPPSRPSSRTSSTMGPPPGTLLAGPTASQPPTSNPMAMSGPAVTVSGGPPSRSESPALGSTPPTLVSNLAPPSLNGPPSGPPSRPGTSMSNASSIDDLLGAPQARKGGSVKKPKRGGRYVDVMNQK